MQRKSSLWFSLHYNAIGGSEGKELACNRETWIQSLGQEDALENGMATDSSILSWRTPWREEPGGLQSMELQTIQHYRAILLSFVNIFKFYFIFKLYIIVLVLPNIKMNPPQVYMCYPSWTLLPPPSPYHPSGSSQCTSPKHPVLRMDYLYKHRKWTNPVLIFIKEKKKLWSEKYRLENFQISRIYYLAIIDN